MRNGESLLNWLKLDKLWRTEESFNLVRWQRGCTGRKRQMMCTGAGGYLEKNLWLELSLVARLSGFECFTLHRVNMTKAHSTLVMNTNSVVLLHL